MEEKLKILFVGKNPNQGLKISDSTSFASIAAALNYSIVTSLDEMPDRLICVDFQRKDLPVIYGAKRLGIPTTLVMSEPTVVIPQHNDPKILKIFDRIVPVSRASDGFFLPWPQTWRNQNFQGHRMDRAILVNSDKWSFIKGQLYWLRSSAAAEISMVDVYGVGWNYSFLIRVAHRIYELFRTIHSGRFPSFRGAQNILSKPINFMGIPDDKILEMSRYRYAIVIENSAEYLSEKIFDAWFSGCLPIYVGPDLSKFNLPNDLVIASAQNLNSLIESLKLAREMDFDLFQSNLYEFLSSEELQQRWSGPKAITRILQAAI